MTQRHTIDNRLMGVPYCRCDAPVMDVEHDAGCRRCGLPVDFTPRLGDPVLGHAGYGVEHPNYPGVWLSDGHDDPGAAIVAAERVWALIAHGTRLRLTCDVDRYPHFIAPAGSVGTVVDTSDGVVSVRMDNTIAGAEDWDNEVVWSLRDGDDITAYVELFNDAAVNAAGKE